MPASAVLRSSLILAVVVLTANALPNAAAAQRRPGTRAHLISLQGYFGAPRREPKGTTELTLRCRKQTYRFFVSRVRVLAGDISPSNVLSDVEPYKPNFILRASEPMADRLRNAEKAESVEIIGYYRRGSRDLMVSEIKLTPAATPTPSSATTPSASE